MSKMLTRGFHWSSSGWVVALVGLCGTVAWADAMVVGEMSREAKLSPGQTLEGKVLVRNTGAEAEVVKAYLTDYVFHADGTNGYGEPGSTARSNAKWVTVVPSEMTIDPNTTTSFSYRIQVPKENELRGSYWCMLMIEPAGKPATFAEPAKDKPQIGVVIHRRYGIQIVTDVGQAEQVELAITKQELVVDEKQRVLNVDLENRGEQWLRPTVFVELFGADGVSIGRFGGEKRRTYPGCSVRVPVNLADVPKGKYTAMVLADCGDENVFGMQCSVDLP